MLLAGDCCCHDGRGSAQIRMAKRTSWYIYREVGGGGDAGKKADNLIEGATKRLNEYARSFTKRKPSEAAFHERAPLPLLRRLTFSSVPL